MCIYNLHKIIKFVLKLKSNEDFWINGRHKPAFWKDFFSGYDHEDVSSALLRTLLMKLLCNEAKLGTFNSPGIGTNQASKKENNYGGLLQGMLEHNGKIIIK